MCKTSYAQNNFCSIKNLMKHVLKLTLYYILKNMSTNLPNQKSVQAIFRKQYYYTLLNIYGHSGNLNVNYKYL